MRPGLYLTNVLLLEPESVEYVRERVLKVKKERARGENTYTGPLPGKVVRVVLTNQGIKAAFGIAERLGFQSFYLEPLCYFGFHSQVLKGDGIYEVELGTKVNGLLPRQRSVTFDIAV